MTSDVQLDTLEAKGLIRVAVLSPELEYLFRHSLVQDAAYGSLLKQERRDLHARVGDALETLYPERRSELAAVLAMHFEQAGDINRAIDYLIEAGQYGYRRFAIQEAYAAFVRAGHLLDEHPGTDDGRGRWLRVQIELGKAESGYSFRPADQVFADLDAIVPEAEALGNAEMLAQVHLLIALGRLQGGASPQQPEVARSLTRIDEIGNQTGDTSLRALPLALIGMGEVFAGSVRDGVKALEESVPLLEERADSIGAAFARGALAMGYATLGEFEKADAAARRATELADERGDLIAQLDALIAESWVRSLHGDLETAVPLARQCVDRAEETGAAACVVASSWVLGDAFHRLGRYAEAREILQRGTDISGVVDRKVWRPTLQAWLGSTMAALGGLDPGTWEEAIATARSIGNRLGEAGILTKRAEAAATRTDWDAAIADYAAGAAIFEAEGARPLLARTLASSAAALRSAGRPAEAEPLARRALAIFEELDLQREAAEVRAALTLGGTTIQFG
jgi:tetratricopeptide (TPR) repeat protein